MNDEILGYTKLHNEWIPLTQPTGYIYTAAFILCKSCKKPVSGRGGPNYNALCPTCYEQEVKDEDSKSYDFSNAVRGAILIKNEDGTVSPNTDHPNYKMKKSKDEPKD